ncbi:MAG TPA: single-stranded DNA-binding protein [Pseudonocardiaceae bacterium]|nr:single-stranded DNA-binding protein [Pseudonocardiaceae bacterium]
MDNVVIGHLCQDPVLRQPRRGSRPVATFTVAVNVWRRVGEVFEQRSPVFHRVFCFGPMAENVSNSLRKGMEVLAVGEWVDDSYSDEQGQRRIQMAMEARVVGPALRRATALVRKVERRTEDGSQPTNGADTTDQQVTPAADVLRRTEQTPQPVPARGG